MAGDNSEMSREPRTTDMANGECEHERTAPHDANAALADGALELVRVDELMHELLRHTQLQLVGHHRHQQCRARRAAQTYVPIR